MQIDLWTQPEPDLKSFDWILVNTSAGKDSQTMMRHVMERCDQAGIPLHRIVAVHADLGRMEWPGCPELAAKQSALNGINRTQAFTGLGATVAKAA